MMRNTRRLSAGRNTSSGVKRDSAWLINWRTSGCSSSARSVAVIPSLVRISSGSPNIWRRRLRQLLIAGWVMPSCSAARVTFFSRSSTSRYLSRLRSALAIFMT